MEPIVTHSGHRYWWTDLRGAADFRAPAAGAPFTCLLWDTTGTWDPEERGALVERLLDAGCRYLVCGGQTCERWHDDADEALAYRVAMGDGPAPEVITTWHADEPVEEVAEFFVVHATVADNQIREHLVLQVGPEWDWQNELMVWVRAWVVHPYGIDAADTDAREPAG